MRGATRPVLEGGYVLTVAVLALVANANPNEFRPLVWVAALVLCLPALIAALPMLYVVAAAAWNLTGADHGGTAWPVTATYVLLLSATAIVNVLLVRWLSNARTRRRAVAARASVVAARPQPNT